MRKALIIIKNKCRWDFTLHHIYLVAYKCYDRLTARLWSAASVWKMVRIWCSATRPYFTRGVCSRYWPRFCDTIYEDRLEMNAWWAIACQWTRHSNEQSMTLLKWRVADDYIITWYYGGRWWTASLPEHAASLLLLFSAQTPLPLSPFLSWIRQIAYRLSISSPDFQPLNVTTLSRIRALLFIAAHQSRVE